MPGVEGKLAGYVSYLFFNLSKSATKGAMWPVTGKGVENTKWPSVLYSQQISQNRKILANLNYHM